ncbi:MAG TPA: thioredoxin family protein [Anaerolineales bacterium]|nr:thioredoxin family protein [Anaerolineales bacterium]
MDTLTLRLLTALALVGLGLLAYAAYGQFTVRRAQNKRLGLESARPGVPAILYFTTPSCVPCRTAQGPAIERLTAALGDALQVIKIDAQEQPDVADHWGVLSVPTTFVIDRSGKPRFFNAGVAQVDKLEKQLLQAGLQPR